MARARKKWRRRMANLNSAKADLENARVSLERTRKLVSQAVMSQQNLDDAQARYDSAVAKVNSLQKAYDLVKIGPRQEQIDAMRGQVEQARGAVAYAETNLANTIIRAPVTGTILERAVENGEFVTTSFVGDRGAKGYVVSLADLNDLEVELDISQNDFAKLHMEQRGHHHHRCVSRPQIRRLHPRSFRRKPIARRPPCR